MPGSPREYHYLPLADAKKCVGLKLNLFAIVIEIGRPKRSRGSDFVVTLKIADKSYSALGLSVNFFAEDATKLPLVRSHGDIVCLHRVAMRVHNGEVYCVFDKKFSAFALFGGKATESINPYQTSMNYHCTDHVKELLAQLRTCSFNHQSDAATRPYLLPLRSIKTGASFDLVCKVLHIHEASDVEWVIFVWDGTDTPPVTFTKDLNIEGENPLPLQLEAMPLPREVLCTFPPVGTVLMIIVDKIFKEITQLQEGAQWVKLCNMTCELQSGIWKGLLNRYSKVRFLSEEDENVKLRQKEYEERVACKIQRQPLASFPYPSCITEADFDGAPYATLIESLTHPEVTHKLKSIVRVIAAYPWRANHICSTTDGCYRIRLTLEDPTARIHAYIDGDDAVKLFGAYPTMDELSRKMKKLLGIDECVSDEAAASAVRDPPWVWCCLKSYYLDKNDPWRSRRYRVFGTVLVG